MKDSLFLAWGYLRHHQAKTLLLVLSLSVFLGLPLIMRAMSAVIQDSLMARAQSTACYSGTRAAA